MASAYASCSHWWSCCSRSRALAPAFSELAPRHRARSVNCLLSHSRGPVQGRRCPMYRPPLLPIDAGVWDRAPLLSIGQHAMVWPANRAGEPDNSKQNQQTSTTTIPHRATKSAIKYSISLITLLVLLADFAVAWQICGVRRAVQRPRGSHGPTSRHLRGVRV